MNIDELKTIILDNANGERRGFKGQPWAKKALSMVSPERLQNLQDCCEKAIDLEVPGDFVETGVWRGGCTILMQAILKERQATDRAVAYLKAAERTALLKSLEQQDPAVSEMLRVAAATYDEACKWVLLAFDETTRKPSL